VEVLDHHLITHHTHHSFAPGAGSCTKDNQGQVQPAGTSAQDLIEEALAARAAVNFSGESGAPVMSGITGDIASAEGLTYGLIRGCFNVVEKLPRELFDPHAAVRPCGKLDTYEAVSVLICEVVGWPFFLGPRAQKLGLKALKLNNAIAGEQAKARRAASRKGGNTAAAAADVLRLPVQLTLPPAEEAAAAAVAPASAPASAPAPDPAPEPTLRPAPGPEVAPQPPPPVQLPVVPNGGKLLRMQGSVLAEDAVLAASGCELQQTWLREGVDQPLGVREGWEEFDAEARETWRHIRLDDYFSSLRALKERFPMKVCCPAFAIGGCAHGTPCECGGVQAPWPWIIHHPTASRFCACHLSQRQQWVRHGIDIGYTSSQELVAEIERIEARNFRPECKRRGYAGSGCSCDVCYVDM